MGLFAFCYAVLASLRRLPWWLSIGSLKRCYHAQIGLHPLPPSQQNAFQAALSTPKGSLKPRCNLLL